MRFGTGEAPPLPHQVFPEHLSGETLDPPEITLDFPSTAGTGVERGYSCRNYVWEDPYLFNIGQDGMLRRCIPESEQIGRAHV